MLLSLPFPLGTCCCSDCAHVSECMAAWLWFDVAVSAYWFHCYCLFFCVQVCGEAKYTDDAPLPPNTLHAALVTSSEPHAKLRSVDASAALAMHGVAAFFSAKDVPGDSCIGPVFPDETCFAEGEVTCVGHVIGVIAADSHDLAHRGAAAVKV
jgi:hypothetical protein